METLDIGVIFFISKCLQLMVEDLLLVDQLLVEGGKEVESKVAKWIFNDDDSWRGKILMLGQLFVVLYPIAF